MRKKVRPAAGVAAVMRATASIHLIGFVALRCSAVLIPDETLNMGCKDWNSEWGFPCTDPHDGWKRVWGNTYPIIAWWPPTKAQLPAYAAANFTLVYSNAVQFAGNVSDAMALDEMAAFVEEASTPKP